MADDEFSIIDRLSDMDEPMVKDQIDFPLILMGALNDVRLCAKNRSEPNGEKNFQDAIRHLEMLLSPRVDREYNKKRKIIENKYKTALDMNNLREKVRMDFRRYTGGQTPDPHFVSSESARMQFLIFTRKIEEIYSELLKLMGRRGYLGRYAAMGYAGKEE